MAAPQLPLEAKHRHPSAARGCRPTAFTRDSRGDGLGRSQVARLVSIAQSAVCLCAPPSTGSRSWGPVCGCFRRELDETGCQEAACRHRRLMVDSVSTRRRQEADFGGQRPSRRTAAYWRGCELALPATTGHPIGQEIGARMTGLKVQRPYDDGRSNATTLQSSRPTSCGVGRDPMQAVRPQFVQPNWRCRPKPI
jgi:hypothetical protein